MGPSHARKMRRPSQLRQVKADASDWRQNVLAESYKPAAISSLDKILVLYSCPVVRFSDHFAKYHFDCTTIGWVGASGTIANDNGSSNCLFMFWGAQNLKAHESCKNP